MNTKINALGITKLLSILSLLFFLLIPSLDAYNNQWSDNEDYVVPSETNVDPGEGSDNQEVQKGPSFCPIRQGSPVFLQSGHFTWSSTDIVLPGKSAIHLRRSYTSNEPLSGMFGNGWISNLESGFIETTKHITDDGSTEVHYIYRKENGLRYTFKDINGTIHSPSGMKQQIEVLSATSFKVTNADNSVDTYSDELLVSREDANGNKREFTYDENGVLESIKDSTGNMLTLTLGANGYVTAITDNNARTWSYVYDENGSLTSVTNPLGGEQNYFYEKYQADNDAQFYYHLTKITDEFGAVITEVTYEKGFTGSYAYKNGRVKSYTEGENNNTYDWKDPRYYDYNTKTDAKNITTKYYLSDSGHITKYLDYNSPYASSIYKVDENMSLSGLIDRNGNEWNQSVDDLGRITSYTSPLGLETTYKYVGDTQEPSEIKSPSGAITKISYDSKRNPTVVTLADNSTYKFSYDSQGNIIDTTNPAGIKNIISNYNANSQPLSIKNALGDTFTFTYNSLSQATTVKDPVGNIATFSYDLLGNITKTINGENETIVYTYDTSGRLLSLKDPAGKTTSYRYDSYGRLDKVTRPSGRTVIYTYNLLNKVIAIADSAGRDTAFSYDNQRRVTKVTVDGGYYISYVYDKIGRITQAYNSENYQSVYYTYNADGQLIKEINNAKTVDYTYDADGNIATLTADGTTITYNRNSVGEIESLSDGTDIFSFEYDTNGLRKSITYPNTLKTNYSMDEASRLVAIDDEFSQNSYIYDKNGMLSRKTVDLDVVNYVYDGARRVTSAEISYNYDAAGNIENNTSVYDADTNKLTSNAMYSFEYNSFGSLTKKTKKLDNSYKVYTWNVWNKLVSVESFTSGDVITKKISFTYGPMGRRLSKTVDGVKQKYLYSNHNIIAIIDAYSTVTHKIIHDETLDSPLAIYDVSGDKSYYYHRDYLGSVINLSDSSGNSVENYSYSAYGVTTLNTSTATTGNPFGFTSRELDDDDLYFYRARYYDPTTGRFLSEDPMGFNSGDFNFYRYALNSPINYIDPYGYGFWEFVGYVAVGAGTAAVAPAIGLTAAGGAVAGGVVYSGVALWRFFRGAGEAMERNNERRRRRDEAMYGDNPSSATATKLNNEGINEARVKVREGFNLPGTFVGGPVISGAEDVLVSGANELLIPNVYSADDKKKRPCQ